MLGVKRTEKYQRLSDITSTNARRALIRTSTDQGVLPKDIGPDKDVRPEAIEWLEREGLVHCILNKKKRRIWRSTSLGYKLVALHQPVYLSRTGVPAYTSSVSMSLVGAGEVMDFPKAA